MSGIIKKDLRIFRGTYKECMAQATEDMKIYLAWDTHEIFVGNRAGGKIKYGGSANNNTNTDIESYFEEFRKEIYEKVEEFASLKVNDLVTPKVDEIINLIDEFDKRTEERLESLVDEIYLEIEKQFSGLTDQFNELEQSVGSISDTLITTKNDISKNTDDISLIKNQLEKLKEKDTSLASDIQTLETRLNTISTKVDKNTSDITSVTSDISGLNGAINRIGTTISTINSNIDGLNKSITDMTEEINDKLSKSEANELYLSKDSLDDIDIGGTFVSYKTGDDIIKSIESLADLSEFKPTFCIIDSTLNEDYNAGTFYYYSNGEIISVATGGVQELTKIISTLSLTVTATDTSGASNIEEVNSVDLDLNITASVDKTDAMSTTTASLKYGNTSETVDLGDGAIVIRTSSINRTKPGRYEISLTGSEKTDTKRYDYIVNNASKTYNIYKPCFIGNDENNLVKLGRSYTGTIRAEKIPKDTDGKELFMYTTGNIRTISMNNNGYIFSLVSDNYTLVVNGVSCSYYKYSLGRIYKELDDIIVSS